MPQEKRNTMKTLMSYYMNSLIVLLVMFSLTAWGKMEHSHMPIAVPESVNTKLKATGLTDSGTAIGI
jgi:hypothetical protein